MNCSFFLLPQLLQKLFFALAVAITCNSLHALKVTAETTSLSDDIAYLESFPSLENPLSYEPIDDIDFLEESELVRSNAQIELDNTVNSLLTLENIELQGQEDREAALEVVVYSESYQPSVSRLSLEEVIPTISLWPTFQGESNIEGANDGILSRGIARNSEVCESLNNQNQFNSYLALTYSIEGVYGSESEAFEAAIAEIVTPYLGRSIDRNDLKSIQDEITRFYIQGGYITSKACPINILDDGTLIVHIIEGRINNINVETIRGESSSPGSALLRNYVKIQLDSAIPGFQEGPVNFTDVENQVRLLALDPLFVSGSVYSVLSNEPEEEGASNLTIYLKEAERVKFNVSFNNYSPPSLGDEGFDWQVNFNSRFFGYGERFYAGGRYNPFIDRSSSTTITAIFEDEEIEVGGSDDSVSWVYGYSLPVGRSPRGGLGTLGVQAGQERKDVLQGLASEFDFRSEVERLSLDYQYPISRTLQEEWTLIGGFTFEEGQTFINKSFPFGIGFGPNNEGISRTSVFSLALEHLRRNSNNVLLSRGQLNIGTSFFGATKNSSSIPDGQFLSLFLQTQMSQKIADNHLLVVKGLAQLTPSNLLPINQFVIGGRQSVRGYRENIRSGDNGFVFSIEDRISLLTDDEGETQLEVSPFFDLGVVWNNSSNPNFLPDDNFLASVGVGLTYRPFSGEWFEPLTLRLDYGIPLVEVESSKGSLQDDGIHFSVGYDISL